MTDKAFIFDGDTFTDEGVALDLAVFADECVFLYLDEWADLGSVTDGAAIEVDEVVELDVLAEFDVRCDFFHFSIRQVYRIMWIGFDLIFFNRQDLQD